MDKLYIPGDLVMTNGAPLGTEQDVVYRVTSSEPLKFEVHYVHELQHLLFGLGINHEMEV